LFFLLGVVFAVIKRGLNRYALGWDIGIRYYQILCIPEYLTYALLIYTIGMTNVKAFIICAVIVGLYLVCYLYAWLYYFFNVKSTDWWNQYIEVIDKNLLMLELFSAVINMKFLVITYGDLLRKTFEYK